MRCACMADDPKNRGPADRERINMDYELRHGSDKFKTGYEGLKEAVKKVRVTAGDVERELSR